MIGRVNAISLLNDLRQIASTILLTVGALLPIVDPLGGAPIFLAMTGNLSSTERERMAMAVARNGFMLLFASVIFGAYVLAFFGLSIPAVQVAGSMVVCSVAWSLLHSPHAPSGLAREEAQPDVQPAAADFSQRAFYPLTLPLTVGPGSISVALTLGVNPARAFPSPLTAVGHVIGITIVTASIYFCYRYAERVLARLGPVGTSVVIRLSAFILLCIGVQIGWNGVHGMLREAFHAG